MRDFGYSDRARSVNAAQAEIHAAFEEVVNRNDESDPRTQRWLKAIKAFEEAYPHVYPEDLRLLEQGALPASDVDTTDILDFLEADPVFFRSGYMKETLLAEVKKRPLDRREIERLQAIIINVVQKPDRREFRRYCRAATAVNHQQFRDKLRASEADEDADVRRRANWVLAALEATTQTPR
ncbi:hypothetical protein ACUXST_002017 [Sphingomonas sp. F9_3S_D5_B_2]